MIGISLVPASYGRPRIRQQRGNESLELEPRAGRVRAHLEGHAFAEQINRQLKVFWRGRGKRQRRKRCRIRFVIDKGGKVQVPCPFGVDGEIRKKLSMRANLI